jgi:protein gp37
MTAIEWTDETWNPFAGCSVVSPGCTNCYAMRQAWRLAHNPVTPQYRKTVRRVNGHPVWTGQVNLAEHKLDDPLRWHGRLMAFVNSMSDLFPRGSSRRVDRARLRGDAACSTACLSGADQAPGANRAVPGAYR